MIRVIASGNYNLIETKGQIKILILDAEKNFAWINTSSYGEILVTSHKPHISDCVLSKSKYRLYKVENEKKLTKGMHLELHVGTNLWQGYLLPTGLPNDVKKRSRIIPTKENITISGI